jgi:hypothetical protein
MKIETYASIRNGKMLIDNRDLFSEKIRNLKDCEAKLTLQTIKDTRSNRQNRYLWGGVYETMVFAFKEHGYLFSAEEIHEKMKQEFLSEDRINELTGEIYRVPGSSAKLDAGEFHEYVEMCRRWSEEKLGQYVMTPEEYYEDHY